jgi:hypothetical protein
MPCLGEYMETVCHKTPRVLTSVDLAALWALWFTGASIDSTLELIEEHDDRDLLAIARCRLATAVERIH